ncbi:hypothetical protein MRX96_007153 [Rhipicephalus microplus]
MAHSRGTARGIPGAVLEGRHGTKDGGPASRERPLTPSGCDDLRTETLRRTTILSMMLRQCAWLGAAAFYDYNPHFTILHPSRARNLGKFTKRLRTTTVGGSVLHCAGPRRIGSRRRSRPGVLGKPTCGGRIPDGVGVALASRWSRIPRPPHLDLCSFRSRPASRIVVARFFGSSRGRRRWPRRKSEDATGGRGNGSATRWARTAASGCLGFCSAAPPPLFRFGRNDTRLQRRTPLTARDWKTAWQNGGLAKPGKDARASTRKMSSRFPTASLLQQAY